MMTGRQRMIVRFAAGTGATAVGRHQILAELAHPHAPPGTWLAAGLVVWILGSDEVTRRLGDLLRAWRGTPGPPPGAGEGSTTGTPAGDPRPGAATALAAAPQALPSPGPGMFMTC
jgi:hypothetical protein